MQGEAVTVVVGGIGEDQNGGDGLKLLLLLPLGMIVLSLARDFQHPSMRGAVNNLGLLRQG